MKQEISDKEFKSEVQEMKKLERKFMIKEKIEIERLARKNYRFKKKLEEAKK